MREIREILDNRRLLIGRIEEDGMSGEITLPTWRGTVICSWGAGWEHVSVSPYQSRIIPSWDDMCKIKEMFWCDNEWVCQYHPPKSEYVSNKDNCLHLWKPTRQELVTPPSCLVGIRVGQTMAELRKELSELEY